MPLLDKIMVRSEASLQVHRFDKFPIQHTEVFSRDLEFAPNFYGLPFAHENLNKGKMIHNVDFLMPFNGTYIRYGSLEHGAHIWSKAGISIC